VSEWAVCPSCGSDVHNSFVGWERHSDGPRHRLILMGLSPDEADRIIQACADAGIAYDTALAALREALSEPPQELARKAAALRDFAASLD
jgi:hypothetical protein